MLYVIDNTVTDPSNIIGIIQNGDAYLVPPAGAAGAWVNEEDTIATWNGSIWSHYAPPAGAEYQVTSGPNTGRIYERTTVTSALTNLVLNADLAYEIPDAPYPNWTIVEVAGGTAVWNAAGYVLLNTTTTGDAGGAKTTFTCVSGLKYRAVINTDSITVVSPDSKLEYVLRNETGAVDIATVEITASGDTEVFFTAAAVSYSLHVRVISSGAAAGEAWLRSIDVFRQAELVANGDFEDGFTDWTNPDDTDPAGPNPLWEIDTGAAAPFAGDYAFSNISYSGHDPDPPLEQTITGLQIGTYYRVAFTSETTPDDGVLSVAFDDVAIADAPAEVGDYDYFFKATATSHVLQFPLTKVGISPFEAKLDNVSMMAALWYGGPIAQPRIAAVSGLVCGVNVNIGVSVPIPGVAVVACGTKRTRPAQPRIAAVSGFRAVGVFKRTNFRSNPRIAAVSGMVANAGRGRNVQVQMTGVSGMRVYPVNPYYTVGMAIDAITELLSAASCSCATDGCGPLQKEALGCLNAAMQRLSASGREWGFVSNVALTLGPGVNQTGEIDLPADVVSVRRCMFRPALDDGATTFGTFELRPLMTRHEVEAYRRSSGRDLWPLTSAESAIAPYNIPIGYFTEGEDLRNGQPNGPPQLRILLAPVFNAARTWKVDLQAHVQPPRLTCENLTDGTRLPVPHRFAETLLVPLAKYYAMSLRWFRRPDLAESIQNQARDALMLTGEFQPANPQAGKEPKGAPAK